ncbi:muconolactone Delta-isomerase family protein [Corynebacterium sp.]|uniref:muconolactone Delta-isomerase family protein n=1 Tax=Corynebacterium sp. TaxID=1720 RepID=UPI0026DFD537|nr:muconolactone Delta-isomerase family protein [Corynebacterium sp.]MDO5512518.1 muconolactone Delta-isomerase family protein [Corynebacterium sp.]
MWLIRLVADLPLDMDPEVRADLVQRSRDLLAQWPGQLWRIPGGLTWVALIDAPEPHALVSALPLTPWLDVSVEPLVGGAG